ncbi:MAG: YgfZ/GcvT domain-containing protein, partial [Rhodospirillales bacterium]
MSDDARYTLLDGRGVLAVAGPDRVDFLQGLVSNDMRKVAPDRAVYAALLTPQGKYLHDFFVVAADDALLLDCERDRLVDLQKRLGVYKLRADVALEDRSDALAVAAVFGSGGPGVLGLAQDAGAAKAFGGGVACVDPRLADAGARVVLPRAGAEAALETAGLAPAEAAEYDRLRLGLGL